MSEHEVIRHNYGVRWCFNCRKRRAFFITITDVTHDSYLPPAMSVTCEHGHLDGDLFPGHAREWEDA